MCNRYRLGAFASLPALATALCSVPAAAQDQVEGAESATEAAAQPPADAAASDDTEIVVTAQKRAENVQDVPISIAAYSGETLAKSNVVTVQDLGKLTTNFQANKGVQSSFLRVNIRGIGAAGNTTIEPSVAIFVDGTYVPRAGAIVGALLDMESVEVLRGPQGTLFGRNASVGALSLHSAEPRDEFAARMTGEIGNGDRYKVDGFVNVPLSDKFAFRLAASQQWFGGYWTNLLDGEQVGGTDDTMARASFKADLDPVEWVVRADYSNIEGDGVTNIDFDPTSVSRAQLSAFRARLGGTLPDTNLNDNKLNQSITADLEDRQWGASSHLSLNLGGGSTVRLINSYRDWKNDQLDGDVIFTPVPLVSREGNYSSESQNHELQFISPTRDWLNGHFDLVAGLYYFREKYRLDEQLSMNAQFCNVILTPVPLKNACNAFLTANGGRNATDQDVTQTVDSLCRLCPGHGLSVGPAVADAGRPLHQGREGRHVRAADHQPVRGLAARPGDPDLPRPRGREVHLPHRAQLRADRGPAVLRQLFDRLQIGRLQFGRRIAGAFDLRRAGQSDRDPPHLRPRNGQELRARREDELARPAGDGEPHFLPNGHPGLPGPIIRRHQLHRPQCRQSAPAGLRARHHLPACRRPERCSDRSPTSIPNSPIIPTRPACQAGAAPRTSRASR